MVSWSFWLGLSLGVFEFVSIALWSRRISHEKEKNRTLRKFWDKWLDYVSYQKKCRKLRKSWRKLTESPAFKLVIMVVHSEKYPLHGVSVESLGVPKSLYTPKPDTSTRVQSLQVLASLVLEKHWIGSYNVSSKRYSVYLIEAFNATSVEKIQWLLNIEEFLFLLLYDYTINGETIITCLDVAQKKGVEILPYKLLNIIKKKGGFFEGFDFIHVFLLKFDPGYKCLYEFISIRDALYNPREQFKEIIENRQWHFNPSFSFILILIVNRMIDTFHDISDIDNRNRKLCNLNLLLVILQQDGCIEKDIHFIMQSFHGKISHMLIRRHYQ